METARTYDVLVVDDEKVARDYIRQCDVWKSGAFRLVAEASGGAEAMRVLKTTPIDIVIMDAHMPVGDGVGLSAGIAASYPEISMLAVSGYDDYDYVRKILRNGAHDYILKHRLDGEVLASALAAIAKEREANRASRGAPPALRDSVRGWLFHDRLYPFDRQAGRLGLIVLAIKDLTGRSLFAKEAVVEGVQSLLERGIGERGQAGAVYHPPNHFIVPVPFEDTVSEAEMAAACSFLGITCCDDLRLVYGLEATAKTCPFFPDAGMYPSYVRHLVEPQDEPRAPARPLTLTIARRRALLDALERMDAAGIEAEITSVYRELGGGASVIPVTKELLDLAVGAAKEYFVDLDFLLRREDLYDWMRARNPDELARRLGGLFRLIVGQSAVTVAPLGEGVSALARKADDFLRQNYHRPLSLADIAAFTGTSESYLSRHFHKETGARLTDRLSAIRVGAAKREILRGLPLKEVAARCGFGGYNYFFKIFREHEGMTPSELLRQEAGRTK